MNPTVAHQVNGKAFDRDGTNRTRTRLVPE